MLRSRAFRPILTSVFFCGYVIIFAGLSGASDPVGIDNITFVPDSHITGPIELQFPPGLEPLGGYLRTSFEKDLAVPWVIEGNRLIFQAPSPSVSVAYVIVLMRKFRSDTGLSAIEVTSNGLKIPGSWDSSTPLLLGEINNVIDSLTISIVGVADTHKVGFNTTTAPLSDSGIIWVTFPVGFDISGITNAEYSDDDNTNDGNQPYVTSISDTNQTVQFQLNQGAQQAIVGSRVSVRFWPVDNHTVANDYTVVVMTTDPDSVIDNGPGVSAPFGLYPDVLDHISIMPDTALTIVSGSSIHFDVAGQDQYDNVIDGLTFIYGVTVDSCGYVQDGVFTALKVGQCYFTASTDGIADSSGLITVVPGPLVRFSISGYPEATEAGNQFVAPVNVTAYDLNDNTKTDYSGDIWFLSDDPIADLPYDAGNPFTMPIDSAGSADFSGSGFILRSAGNRTITVTDGTISDTSIPIMVSAADIYSFLLQAGSPLTAGESFQLQVPYPSAIDSFGNLASGIVFISASYGGGDSPDGIPPSLNRIIVTDGTGFADQILTNAIPTVLGGSVAGATAETDTLEVQPGDLGRFEMTGYPDSVTAGGTFPGGVIVSVYDIFGNSKTNYLDSVYFTSSDGQALLPAGHLYVPADSGSYTFDGGDFSLRTAGEQTITATDDQLAVTSYSIHVYPGQIFDFILLAPTPVTAGIPFTVGVNACRDQWNNLTDGIVAIEDSIGGGASPNGTPPVFNAIRVVSGTGSAFQTLVNTDTTVLKGTSGLVVVVTDNIEVIPGSILGSLDLIISSPQINGIPFSGLADLTAYDFYGNVKTDFDASFDTVVISSSADGSMANNILNQPDDFTDGIADLEAEQTTYYGRGGVMTFAAESESGVGGFSGPVNMRAIFCNSLIIHQAVASWGDTVTGAVNISNDGDVGVEISDIDVVTYSGELLQPVMIDPNLPDSIGPGQDKSYDFSIEIHSGLGTGVHPVTSIASGWFGVFSVTDTLDGYPDTLEIQSASVIGYVSGSLSRDTLSRGERYSLSLDIGNSGSAGFGLIDSSHILLSDGILDFRADISSGVYLPPLTPLGTTVILDSALVPPDFEPGLYRAIFNYYGQENGHFLSGSFDITDSIAVQSGAAISYMEGSLNIDSIVPGQNAAFSVRVRNEGTASFNVDHENTRISFTDSEREFVAFSDTASSVRVDYIMQGDTTLYFSPTILVPEFSTGTYLPMVTLKGVQNGLEQNVTLYTIPDSVDVLSRGTLRIDSTYMMARNVPFVNMSQPCSLKVIISNSGDEAILSSYIHLDSDGNSVHQDSILITDIEGNSSRAIMFSIVAGSAPDSGELFVSTLSGGTGGISGLPAQILQPIDNTALLIIETPAELSLSPIIVTSPPQALDDTITIGQDIALAALVINLGQADLFGPQILELDSGSSGFTLADSANRNFILDEEVFWDLTAPADPAESATLYVRFFSRPGDVNDGSDAVGPDSVSSITFVVNTTPDISHNPVISEPDGALDGIVSTDQNLIITDTLTALGIYTDLTASIVLPPGFTSDDPLVLHPSGNMAAWHIRAPSAAMNDSIWISSWLYDVNTGDSIGTGADYIDVIVVDRAELRLSSRISGPRAAIDGIIEPGGNLQYEAQVHNNGDAAAGTGRISLHMGHPDMIVEEAVTRDFNPDTPVVWNIVVPDTEISVPIPVWVSIDSIPDDENTNAPAYLINDSSSVSIIISALLPQLIVTCRQIHTGSVVNEQDLIFMSFSLRNRDMGGSFSIGVTEIDFAVGTSPPADPSRIFSEASLISASGEIAADDISPEGIGFALEDTLILEPGETVELSLRLMLSADADVEYFLISLDGNDIAGVVIEDGEATVALSAISPGGDPILWQSDPTVILEQSFAGSISSYPNPFNPRTGVARIGYYLEGDSDLDIKIFTLLGELVWSEDISRGDPLGQAGLHTGQTAVLWDGKNDSGYEVKSGVYICMIRNSTTGEEEKFKIAVVK